MAETAVYNPERQCDGKRPFRTKGFAKRMALVLTSGSGAEDRRSPRKATTYRCPWCGFWHVGHKPSKTPEVPS